MATCLPFKENPKSELRNPKQIRISNDQNLKHYTGPYFAFQARLFFIPGYLLAIIRITIEAFTDLLSQSTVFDHLHYQIGFGHQVLFAQGQHGFAHPGKRVQTGVVGDFKWSDIPAISQSHADIDVLGTGNAIGHKVDTFPESSAKYSVHDESGNVFDELLPVFCPGI